MMRNEKTTVQKREFKTFNWNDAKNKLLCSEITFSFDMDAVGLVGGDFESQPSVHTWCSFNPHRIMRSHAMDELVASHHMTPDMQRRMHAIYRDGSRSHKFDKSNMNWFFGTMLGVGEVDEDEDEAAAAEEEEEEEKDPALDFYIAQNNAAYRTRRDITYDMSWPFFHGHRNMRTDASVWFKLMTVSRFSGVLKIDEQDRKFKKVDRDIQSGVCQIELYDLFRECLSHKADAQGRRTFHFESAFIDPKLMQMEMTEQVQAHQQRYGANAPISQQEEARIIQTAFVNTRKAVIHFTASVKDFDERAYRESLFGHEDLKTSPVNSAMDMRALSGVLSQATQTLLLATLNNNSTAMTTSSFSRQQQQQQQQQSTTANRKPFNPILYNSVPGIATLRQQMNEVTMQYCNAFLSLDERQESRYQARNENVKKLHMPYFIGEQGQTPVINYFSSHIPGTREYPNEEMRAIEMELYDSDDRAERHFELMLRASARRHGMSLDKFVAVIRHHFDVHANTSPAAQGDYVMALKIISDAATFAANSAHYTADFRYRRVPGDGTHSERLVHTKKINLDSFDSTILNGSGNADDCEGQGNVAASILEKFRVARFMRGGRWDSPVLEAVRQVLDRSIIYPVGSTVTSAYVDNNNKPVDMKKENRTLPVIGDEMDVRSHCDGHCFALLITMAVTDHLLRNGNLDKQRLEALRQRWFRQYGREATFHAREYTVPIMVLEGTGSVEPTVLPVDEVWDGEHRAIERVQIRAATAFMKGMKTRLTGCMPKDDALRENRRRRKRGEPEVPLTEEQLKAKSLMEMFNGEGLAYYVEKRPTNERVSQFYREVIHGVPCHLYAGDVTLSQIAFCKRNPQTGEFEYGVDTGELLRSGVSRSKDIALITPFADQAHEWDTQVVPMIEAIQNQMPIMAFGHYTEEDYADRIYSRYLPTENKPGYTQQQFEALIESVSGNPRLAMVRLQSREWKLTDKARLEALNTFLMQMPGVVCHGFFAEKHLPNCDALVDILLVVETRNSYE